MEAKLRIALGDFGAARDAVRNLRDVDVRQVIVYVRRGGVPQSPQVGEQPGGPHDRLARKLEREIEIAEDAWRAGLHALQQLPAGEAEEAAPAAGAAVPPQERALNAAERGLEIAPLSDALLSLRFRALVALGRHGEASKTYHAMALIRIWRLMQPAADEARLTAAWAEELAGSLPDGPAEEAPQQDAEPAHLRNAWRMVTAGNLPAALAALGGPQLAALEGLPQPDALEAPPQPDARAELRRMVMRLTLSGRPL